AREILDKLEAAGKKYTTLRADVNYNVVSRLTGDEETRTGRVAYQRKTKKQPAKFRISFDKLRLGKGKWTKNKVAYIFDGHWLIIAKYKIKSMTRIQLAPPDKQIEPLKIGKGPFPIPFGQKADDILKYLEVTTKKSTLPGQEYLKFVPRKKHKKSVNFTRMEMWVDAKTFLPKRVVTRNANKEIVTTDFSNIKTKAKIDPSLFKMEKPAGWSLTVEPLKKSK
ncbi:MAG: hypothetical protein K8S55_14705, partial [Phycisphaerae bacterium]|nr:hypothetical protein [Phycisphaerae bacterium]